MKAEEEKLRSMGFTLADIAAGKQFLSQVAAVPAFNAVRILFRVRPSFLFIISFPFLCRAFIPTHRATRNARSASMC
jgi:hypothetical protein